MRKLKFIGLFLLLVGGLPGSGCAQEFPKAGIPAAEESAQAAIPVANKADLNKAIGAEVTIAGKVSRAGKSSSGHVFLNFDANSQLTVFIDAEVVKKFAGGDPDKTYAGKTIEIRGKLEKYRDKLQVRLGSPEEITIQKEKPNGGNAETPKPVELKSLGKEEWLSPVGVRYVGRDPEGLSRKDHVLRHAKDQPNRDGPHGVFDGGEELAFAWIDEAWEKAKKEKIRPNTQDGRDAYTISLGRRVGFLGGKTGAERKHPPLTKVFLVVRQGTSEVITAFPR
jgi:hypothetical protein